MAEGTRLAQLAEAVAGLQQAHGAIDQAQALQQQSLERQQHSLERMMQQLAGVNTRLDNLLQNQRQQGGELGELAPRNNDIQGICLAVPRVEFPRFEGEDPMSWLYKANHFFAIHNTHPQHRIMLASYYMEGPALVWFQEIEHTGQLTSWENLSRAIMVRFGPSAYDDPAAQFKRLSHSATVEEYKAQFEFLSNRLPHLSEEYKLSCFLAGLREELEIPVRLANPTNVTQAFGVAKLQERYLAITHKPAKFVSNTSTTSQTPHPSISQKHTPPGPPPQNQPSTKNTINTTRITSERMRERREKGLCYYCDEKWHSGHRCKKPTSFLLEGVNFGVDYVLENGRVKEEWVEEPTVVLEEDNVEISLQAITGSPSPRTMRVMGKFGNHSLIVLIDSGSTHCFIDAKVARKLLLPTQKGGQLHVTVANGDKIPCQGLCEEVSLEIQGSASQSQAASTASNVDLNIWSKVSTTVGGKASLQPKRTPLSNEEIESILLGGCV